MKFTLALFLGAVSANSWENLLKIDVHNTDDIAQEWEDVEATWEEIKHSRPVRNLGSSLERWGNSEEVHHLKALDEKFKASPAGKRLVAEWTDVFETLDDVVEHTDTGIHIDNDEMSHLEDELDDVADQYEKLEGSKWDHAFQNAWKDALTNREWGSVQRRGKAFKHSPQGKALKKEVHEFGHTLKKNVKVTDIPEHWKKE